MVGPRPGDALDESYFARDTLTVAADLIGVELLFRGRGGLIVEAEAYTDDAASHYVTRHPSAGRLMGSTFGRIYVYRIYGTHCCLNFTTDAHGPGAVLIRALEPLHGLSSMRRRRGVGEVTELCSGPAKLVQALGIGLHLTGDPVTRHFTLRPRRGMIEVATSPRIGISRATDLPWRFSLRDSPHVGRPPRKEAAR
jgi:DNA-3-methyladenine glycosylase